MLSSHRVAPTDAPHGSIAMAAQRRVLLSETRRSMMNVNGKPAKEEEQEDSDAPDEQSSAKRALCSGAIGLTFRSEGYEVSVGEAYEVAFQVAEPSVLMWHWFVDESTVTFKASVTPSEPGAVEVDLVPEMRSQKHRSCVACPPGPRPHPI